MKWRKRMNKTAALVILYLAGCVSNPVPATEHDVDVAKCRAELNRLARLETRFYLLTKGQRDNWIKDCLEQLQRV